jgi:hypothetical protein
LYGAQGAHNVGPEERKRNSGGKEGSERVSRQIKTRRSNPHGGKEREAGWEREE